MNKFFHVKSGLNHSGTRYVAGDVFEGTIGEFQGLVDDGVLEVVEGETVEEARETVAEQKRVAEAEAAGEETPGAKNTWEAKKDDEAKDTSDEDEEDEEDEEGDDLETLTKDKLIKLAKKEKLDLGEVSDSNTKAEIVEAIRGARSGNEDASSDKEGDDL